MMGPSYGCGQGHPSELTSLYRLVSATGQLLYVGITKNLTRRLYEHSTQRPWFSQVDRVEVTTFSCREHARHYERAAIAAETPCYNKADNLPPTKKSHVTLCPGPDCRYPTKPWDDGIDDWTDVVMCAYKCVKCEREWLAEWLDDGTRVGQLEAC